MNVTRFIIIAIVASSIDIAAEWILMRRWLTPPMRVVVACTPIPGNVALLVLVVRAVRKLDEFQKRVHFEAVVIAFLSTGVLVFIYGFLQQAEVLPPFNGFLIWAFMLITYAIGYAIAIRQYA